jgi:hypothetical protein
MENLGIFHEFCGRLEFFTVFRYVTGHFGMFFPRFGILWQERSGNPAPVTIKTLISTYLLTNFPVHYFRRNTLTTL